MVDPRIQKMAQVIVNYSTAVQAGDVVFIRGLSPLAEPLMQMLYQEVLATGAQAWSYMHMTEENSLAVTATDDLHLLAQPNPMVLHMTSSADVLISIHAATDINELSRFPPEKQSARSQANYAPISIQKERLARGEVRRCTTLFPTEAYAQAAGMSLPQYAEFVFRACKLHLDDPIDGWNALRARQEALIRRLSNKQHLHIAGDDINLRMSIEGRKFINSAGAANFPDGEVFTSPVEDSVNGWVRFKYPAFYHSVAVQGVELHFEAGKVVKATATHNEDFLHQMLDIDENARFVGEFAIGTNTDIQQYTGSTLFDEKMGGTVHLALGQGFPEAGGLNKSGLHWDMIYDLRDNGQIIVDDQIIFSDGDFK